MDRLVASLGITGLSKSQVSEMAKELDAHVAEFRTRSLAEAGPFTFLAADALVLKVREGGRVVPVHALVAEHASCVDQVSGFPAERFAVGQSSNCWACP